MDTRRRKKEVYHFIIIVPHRDSLKPLEEYRAKLFAAGFPGAFSFPMAAPLASVSRFLSVDELKELGRNIRELTNKTDGKIFCSGNSITKFTTENTEDYTEDTEKKEGLSFFGPGLSLTIEESLFSVSARAKIIDILSSPVLCAALLAPDEKPPSEEGPVISFRAASLANLAIRPLESGAAAYSFEWKMGPLIWLPKYKGGQ
ncbi:MAG: hypothetical protein LBQ94_00175 [Treponema sp.]|nr:hypothetical protein [Treponema sp.]